MRSPIISLCLGLLVSVAGAEDITVVVKQPYQAAPADAIYVARAVFAEGRLWALSDKGALSSIAPGDLKRRNELAIERILDICRAGDRALALICADRKCATWKLLEAGAGDWQVRATLESRNETFVALHCDPQEVLVLSNRRAIHADGRQIAQFSKKLQAEAAAVAATPNYLFVGFNHGEWGGGMVQIDRRTGRVKRLEKHDPDELCGGPLDPNCDPVTAILPVKSNADCVLAAIGLFHLGAAHGRIVEACGDEISEFYSNRRQPGNPAGSAYGESDAMFGMARVGDEIFAVGIQGIYRLGRDAVPHVTTLPPMQEVDGLWVNFDSPDVVLMQAGVDSARALLAPRKE